MTASFKHLLAPGAIGRMPLRNRIFMTAMGSNLAEEDGICGERIRAYYGERARGGAALLTMGSVSIGFPAGTSNPRQVAIADDRHIPGIRALAETVHGHGAKLALQLHFGGLSAVRDILDGRPLAAPSLPETPAAGDTVAGYTEEELAIMGGMFATAKPPTYEVLDEAGIRRFVALYASAAERAQRAGVDGVEIHAGHGYLISAFLSPYSNRRTDAYGGSVENRSRFLVEIITAIRAAVGPDYPVWCKLDSQEFMRSEGITVADACITARLAEAAGADAITVSAYHDGTWGEAHSASHTPYRPDNLVANAAAIKAAVSIPVITAGQIEPDSADRHIAAGRFDFVAMGRKLLADPQLPAKLIAGRPQDVRPCIYCYTCISQIYFGNAVRCAVNPETGCEYATPPQTSREQKHYAVIGGGPAGMEAARRLAQRGHRVTLFEQAAELGGTARFAAIAFAPNERIVRWLRGQLAASAVEVRLNTAATPQRLAALKPDAVIVATGARRDLPTIDGADRPFVFSGDDMRRLVLGQQLDRLRAKTSTGTRLLLKLAAATGINQRPAQLRRASHLWMPLGRRVVIIGSELVALELAEFLAERGRRVCVVDEAERFGSGLALVRRWRVLAELRRLQVELIGGAQRIAIEAGAVLYTNAHGQQRRLAAHQVVIAKGARADLALAETLRADGFEVHTIGDCNGVGYIDSAINAAAQLVQQL